MKQLSLLLLLITTCLNSYSFDVQEITKSEIPTSIKIKGELKLAYKWSDINGVNYLILSTKGPFKSENKETLEIEKSKYLFGEQYTVKNKHPNLLWDIKDF